MDINDYMNLMQLVRRATGVGLDECAVIVGLAQKVSAQIEIMQEAAKKGPEVKDK